MPQETNLNVFPYYDDFDPIKDYYKVLFKPGYPIQARELTNLQSILQNQIENFGSHIFKEGSMVIPGQIRYENPINAVEVESQFGNIPISVYFKDLVGKKVRGSLSGVSAEIFYVLSNINSERNNYTLYVKYLESGGSNFENKIFQDGETLVLESSLSYGELSFSIPAGQGVANVIRTSRASGVSIASGIYFVRGIFARVSPQFILLDQYSLNPSYKVGFNVIESIVNQNQDESLSDNAQGFNNYAAPGADRFSMELVLDKRDLNDLETSNFVELLRVSNGIPEFFNTNVQYNLIRDELAKRTFDESGNYFVKPFTLFVRDSLNDRVLSNGIYFEGQQTINGNIPSEDMMVYQIGPGKAYVNGYDVETISARLLDVKKPRTTKTLQNQVIPYNAGSLVVVNNIYGSAAIGLGTDATVSLNNSRLGLNKSVAAGDEIGVARVYDFVPESDYVDNTSRLSLRLFDIQTYTKIGLTAGFSSILSKSTHIKGKRSNASGYLTENLSIGSKILTLYNVSGNFLENEPIIIDSIEDSRLINEVTDYSINDIKSIYSNIDGKIFNCDTVLDKKSYIAKPGTTFRFNNGVVSAGLENTFTNTIKIGDIISYTGTSFSGDPIYNVVTNVGAGGTNFTVSSIISVSGVCNGTLTTGTFEVTNVLKISSILSSENSSLLTRLNQSNISSINFDDGELKQRRIYKDVSVNSNSTISVTIDSIEKDIFFDSFDEDRFVITYSDGSIEPIRRDKYDLDTTGKILTFRGLTKSSGTADIITTIINLKPTSKIKKLNKVSTLIVDGSKYNSSGIGTTTLNDGLSYRIPYGTRVQDDEISLNVCDVIRVIGIYESNGIEDPFLPRVKLTSFTNPLVNNQNFIIGEQIIGETTGSVAIVVSKIDSDSLEYVYLNTFQFAENETIVGKESNTRSTVSQLFNGSKNITQNYLLDDGQRDTIYDYSRIVRKKNVEEPKKKLKIVFQNYTIDSLDTGEFVTANSYAENLFKHDISYYQNSRLTDYIDIRPRVAPYVLSTKSPFEFDSRNFDNSGQYSKYPLCPDENIVISYSYYLGRIDRVYLNSDGTFEVSEGIPSENPVPPPLKSNAFDIATIYIPPYVYNAKNINVDMSVHKRYRMQDISLLEDRIERVEKFTTLSMLESKTENFTIRDVETGLDRFKSGFFVDNFNSHEYHDLQNPSFRTCIDTSTNTLRPLHYTTSIDLQLGSEVIEGIGTTYEPNKDQSYVSDLGSPGIRKTGDLITLNYNNIQYFEQPYASKTESVTPFLVKYWSGLIELNPPIDSWVEERTINTTSFNEVVNNQEPLPDENITRVQNVVVNREVWTNPPLPQTGIPPFDWITNARNILTGIRRIGGIDIDFRPDLNSRIFSNNVQNLVGSDIINLAVIRDRVTDADRELIRRLLPTDAANNFLTEIGRSTARSLSIRFVPGNNGSIIENRVNTTSTESTSNTRTIIIPPEILTTTTTSESISNYTEPVRFLRSRNIEFDVKGLRPVTRFYSFFEGIDVSKYIIPKLLEIEMISGKFEIGETVESDPHFVTNKIRFRLCKPNHRTGPFDGSNPPFITNPIPVLDFTTGQILDQNNTQKLDIFALNPYNQSPFPEDYSESSTVLNVDTRSLQMPSETNYFGSISAGMRLIGKKSGAIARISNIRLVSDNQGRLIGSLFIPDPNVPGNPQWINGENTFTVIDTQSLQQISNESVNESSAEAEFSSSAVSNVTESNIITTRNVTIIPARNINVTTITNTTTNLTTITQRRQQTNPTFQTRVWENVDPLAQSFYVREDTGIFLTAVDVFFETKDDSIPVTLQIRTMSGGVPSNVVIPFSEVTYTPDKIEVSSNGSVATRFTFPSPVYLPGPQQLEVRQSPIASQQTSEFAVVLLSNSPQYRVFVAELGKDDIQTGIKLSAQPTLGSLFKSQNGSTWTPSQLEDLKYRLYRADFVNEGLVRFFNPTLSLKNQKITVTGENQFTTLSKKIIVGLGSTGFNQATVKPGITLKQNLATGTLVAIGGSITQSGLGVTVSQVGVGYTPTSGQFTFTNVILDTETGSGQGAVANITVNNGSISSATITNGGFGYSVGDSLIIPENNFGLNVGFGGKLTVDSISVNNSFIIDNIQGTFVSGMTTINYINSSGTEVPTGIGVTINDIIEDQYYDGLHMKIYHMNHCMHSSENYVSISDVRPSLSEVNTKLSTQIDSSTLTIPVLSNSGFETFEGKEVNTSNPGYVIIGNEIIKYTSLTGENTIFATERGIDGTQSQSYDSNVPVYKYEFNGISLRRINKVHNFTNVDKSIHAIDLNSYHIKVNMSDSEGTGTNRSNDLYFQSTEQTGRSGALLSNNIQYEALTPNIAHIIPSKTNISTRVRTTSGTSIGGNEKSFIDQGFVDIPIDQTTYFANPNIICSEINETNFLNETPGSKSFTMEFLMNSSDSRVSPVIDTIRTSAILTSNLINNPLGIGENSNYADDDSVRSLINDKHSAIYISKPIRLKIPANSLKVILTASRNEFNDMRVLYQLFRSDAENSIQYFELFPGYSNYSIDGQGIKRVVDLSKNDGSSDSFVQQSSDRSFREYEYSIDDLPDFDGFAIKLVMSSSNQATPPIISQLRAIATIKPKV
jgi:hypothetical protein